MAERGASQPQPASFAVAPCPGLPDDRLPESPTARGESPVWPSREAAEAPRSSFLSLRGFRRELGGEKAESGLANVVHVLSEHLPDFELYVVRHFHGG